MSDYLLQMNGIVKTFGGVNALNGIDIKVRPGNASACAARTAPVNQP